MDRRHGRLGASGCRRACSAGAAGHTTFDCDAEHAQYLGPAHLDTWGSSADDDSADAHEEARGHFGRVLAPLGRFPIQQISTLRRMEFSPETHQFGLRPPALAPKMTAKRLAGAR